MSADVSGVSGSLLANGIWLNVMLRAVDNIVSSALWSVGYFFPRLVARRGGIGLLSTVPGFNGASLIFEGSPGSPVTSSIVFMP